MPCGAGAIILYAQFLAALLNAEELWLSDIESIITRKFKRLEYCIVATSDDTFTPSCPSQARPNLCEGRREVHY